MDEKFVLKAQINLMLPLAIGMDHGRARGDLGGSTDPAVCLWMDLDGPLGTAAAIPESARCRPLGMLSGGKIRRSSAFGMRGEASGRTRSHAVECRRILEHDWGCGNAPK
jgi:hypothetical protein